jgi:hypothetical protein
MNNPEFGQALTESTLTLVRFPHANSKETIYVIKQSITGFYRSEAQKCTYLVTTSNTIFPTSDTAEEVKRKLGYPLDKVEEETKGETNVGK